MKSKSSLALGLVVGLVLLGCRSAQAEEHRATRLGSPATRFAPPLATPEDLRARFRDEMLKPDIASILHQWGWPGDLSDLHRAAATSEITEVQIPVGARMPFMSSRDGGQPVCLRNVLWEGREPIAAYAFAFASNGRRYRCVTPKACSNFFLEDLGAPVLTLVCDAPAEALVGQPVKVCLVLRNAGDAAAPQATVTLPVPDGATYLSPTNGAVSAPLQLSWDFPNLAPGASQQLCAVFVARQAGSMAFAATASADQVAAVRSSCATRVAGISGIRLEVVDLEDPVGVGEVVTYEIKVTDQGSAALDHIRLVCTLPACQQFVSGSGITAVSAQGEQVTTESLPVLAPKEVATWSVVVKALAAADARFSVELYSDEFAKPIQQVESTRQY